MRGLWTAIGALLIPAVLGQQPVGLQVFTNYTGLTEVCKDALATNVTCPPFLLVVSPDNAILDEDQVTELCVNDCYTSLKSARATIQAACTEDTDVIVYEDVAYPATFIADNYLFTYDVSCRKDESGNYCDPQFLSWANRSAVPSMNASCSDCWLGVLETQLNSPLGYDEGMEETFSSLTSSCIASGYSVTSPTAYALNATATATETSATATSTTTLNCVGLYQAQQSDDCNSVAKLLSVSTYSLLQANKLDLYCQDFASMMNRPLCVPPKCNTYTWKGTDTCDSVVGPLGNVTIPQFLSWNPYINSLCLNSDFFIGYEVCLSPPGGYLSHNDSDSGSTPNPTTTDATTAAPVPTNAIDGSNHNCSLWYTVQAGDTCAQLSIAQSISLPDFYFLNPEIDADCTNLQLDEAYCVKPVGSLTSYPNYTLTGYLPITVPTATFSSVNTDIPTTTSYPGFVYTEPTQLPTAPDTLSGCYEYANPSNINDLCRDLARDYEISMDQLVEWNPSLSNNKSTCTLTMTYSYCVLEYSNSTATEPTLTNCLSINATESGTASNCNCLTSVDLYDSPDYTCADIVSDYGVTLADLQTWNTWLLDDCDTALFSGLNFTDYRAICIGVGSTDVTATSTATATSTGTSTQTTASIGPTQTGIVSGCQEFYTAVDGDSCSTIASGSGISLAEFYQWNPAIGSTCGSLWLGYAYCVKGPASTTTTVGPSAPTQTGIVSNCEEYHTVVSGDSCPEIQTTYGITFAQFYQWNPAIGSTCSSLWLDYAYCVKGPGSTATATGPSAPTQTGIVSNCDKYYTVVSGDSCAQIQTTYGITFAQLYKWNPAIGSDCQTLAIGYSVCVGVSAETTKRKRTENPDRLKSPREKEGRRHLHLHNRGV
ncbi:uncharacterized protein N7479_004872 [Penicillium vulpinum]|nr:uncharacterized protein N7479_004872 [Penicillium vulpinum]KAJ5964996.1 hypothetical protein N7479_004872 [Penicillium vulpinum]